MNDDKVKSKSIDDETKFYGKIAHTMLPEEQKWFEEATPQQETDTSELELAELSSEYHKLQEDTRSLEKKIQKLFNENFEYCEVVLTSVNTYIYLDEINKEGASFLNTLSSKWEIAVPDKEGWNLRIKL